MRSEIIEIHGREKVLDPNAPDPVEIEGVRTMVGAQLAAPGRGDEATHGEPNEADGEEAEKTDEQESATQGQQEEPKETKSKSAGHRRLSHSKTRAAGDPVREQRGHEALR